MAQTWNLCAGTYTPTLSSYLYRVIYVDEGSTNSNTVEVSLHLWLVTEALPVLHRSDRPFTCLWTQPGCFFPGRAGSRFENRKLQRTSRTIKPERLIQCIYIIIYRYVRNLQTTCCFDLFEWEAEVSIARFELNSGEKASSSSLQGMRLIWNNHSLVGALAIPSLEHRSHDTIEKWWTQALALALDAVY